MCGFSQVFVMTTLMASCSGLGAVPFFFLSSLSEEWAALANAVACGVMLAASFDLVHEGQPYGAAYTILGVILGGPPPPQPPLLPPLQPWPLPAAQNSLSSHRMRVLAPAISPAKNPLPDARPNWNAQSIHWCGPRPGCSIMS